MDRTAPFNRRGPVRGVARNGLAVSRLSDSQVPSAILVNDRGQNAGIRVVNRGAVADGSVVHHREAPPHAQHSGVPLSGLRR